MMIRCTSTFTTIGKDKRSELIALLFSLLFSVFFLGAFAFLFEPEPLENITCSATLTPPAVEVKQAEKPPDPNDRFRIVPENFAHIDFKNWRYGRYRFGEQNLNLILTAGEQVIPNEEGGGGQNFFLTDVLYTDVTGDGKPEAIVQLVHVQCGGSCDGGSHLFHVYQSGKSGLRRIWEYETGSRGYGCGLKSLTVTNKQIALEMFGQCWKPASSFEGSGKFMVRDLTRSVFHFNGKRFVKRLTEVTAAQIRDVKNYTPEVHIKEN